MYTRILIALILLYPSQARTESFVDSLIQCLNKALASVDGLTALEVCERQLGVKLTYVSTDDTSGTLIPGVTLTCTPRCSSEACADPAFGSCRVDRPNVSRFDLAFPSGKPKNPFTSWGIAFE